MIWEKLFALGFLRLEAGPVKRWLVAAPGHQLAVLQAAGRDSAWNELCQVPGLECEVFVHGAMCMAYSGRCLLSAALTGRHANRGVAPSPAAGATP
jgi:hypothetical protein